MSVHNKHVKQQMPTSTYIWLSGQHMRTCKQNTH